MRIRSFNSIAIYALALGLTGCRVQSVLVMPTLAPYFYATAGQTLEWQPSDPKATIYVVFDGASPCKELSLQIGPKPATCKVLEGRNGYFAYHFQTEKPGTEKTILTAKSCPYCRFVIVSGNNTPAVYSKEMSPKEGSVGYILNVTCDKETGRAVVLDTPAAVLDDDRIQWNQLFPYEGLKITTSNICSGATNGVFAASEVCTVTGSPAPTAYTYSVQLSGCKDGSGTLTINPAPK